MKFAGNRGGVRHKQLLLESISGKFKQAFAAGQYQQALDFALQATRLAPRLVVARCDVSACLIRLERWEEAIAHARQALNLGPSPLAALDALAHAHGMLRQWDDVRVWGRKALVAREVQFARSFPIPLEPAPLPPAPSAATRQLNIIAFSLFGASPKYCETAVLNASERQRLYPDWTCHFYVDETVPEHVLRRLAVPGSRVFHVDEEQRIWPGPMWRFIASDHPGLHRVIFRDADSVISNREALAVREWVDSPARFHLMRDAPSHTELLLAGLWGCVGGGLPSMRKLVAGFLEKPLVSRHFADQYFLREWVWPYARESLMHHDSVFALPGSRPFPDGPRRDDFHVGSAEGATAIGMHAEFPDGTTVNWTLYEKQPQLRPVCTYPAVATGGRVKTELPKRIALALAAGEMLVRIEPADPG